MGLVWLRSALRPLPRRTGPAAFSSRLDRASEGAPELLCCEGRLLGALGELAIQTMLRVMLLEILLVNGASCHLLCTLSPLPRGGERFLRVPFPPMRIDDHASCHPNVDCPLFVVITAHARAHTTMHS